MTREAVLLDRLREVTVALRETRTDLDALLLEKGEPIAIVGIGCRFPGGASGPDAYWELLDAGGDAIKPLDGRWALAGARPGGDTPRWAGLLTEEIDTFDASFFGIAPREARSLDPQQRLLLEIAWEALEDAGVVPTALAGSRTGVFVGACTSDYLRNVSEQPREERDAYGTTGTMLSVAAGRLSYTLGLEGPCLTVDTACSSSLVAVHLACRSLRARESDLALAGGVSLLLSPDTMDAMARTQALSPEGRCRTFDALANGFVRGEGCGLVVLKRLSDAQRDGDRIFATIRGSAINQDGRSTGLTAPNVRAQEAVLREALRSAGVEPTAIGYVETHGTGTSLGDPIEVDALRAVTGAPRSDGTRCILGAVKTNIGHLEGAAGVAGLVKAALALHRERIPKNLNFRTLNPRIRLEGTALALADEATPWPRTERPRFAGASSFGLSGTNAHVILEEAPATSPKPPLPARAELFMLSAKTAAALEDHARRLAVHVEKHPTLGLGELAFTLATTRAPMDHRRTIVATTRADLATALTTMDAPAAIVRGKIAFLFTGQGAQVPGMGRGLSAAFPIFREAFDRCIALFDRELGGDLRHAIWEEAALLDRTAHTQPALFALEHALAVLWRSWGVEPDLVLGHSIGEIAAACVAGVFSIEDAVRLTAARGRLMEALPAGGAMVSIAAAEHEVIDAITPHVASVAIAAVNGPADVVISGATAEVSAIATTFSARGVRTKALKVSHAFHSPSMGPMLDAFRRVAESIDYRRPTRPFVSASTGKPCTDEVATPGYWVRHARETVRFADAARSLLDAGARTFIEIGPKPVLLGLLPEDAPGIVRLASLRSGADEATTALQALGGHWSRGGSIDAAALFPADVARAPLPTYPWQRERHWIDLGWPLAGARVSAPEGEIHRRILVGIRHQDFLRDHVVLGEIVVPGAFFASVILAISEEHWRGRAIEIAGLELVRAIVLSSEGEVELRATLTPCEDGVGFTFTLATDGVHARGCVRPIERAAGTLPRPEALAARAVDSIADATWLARMAASRIDWGPMWRWARDARVGAGVSTATIVPPSASSYGLAPLHPILLDNGFGMALLGGLSTRDDPRPPVPFAIERLRWWRAPRGPVRCGAVVRASVAEVTDFVLEDDDGVVAEVEGLAFRRARADAFLKRDANAAFYQLAWEEAPLPGDAVLPNGTWIIVAPEGSTRAAALSRRLARTVVVTPGALGAVLARETATAGVVCFWDARADEAPPRTALRVVTEGLEVVKALLSRPTRLWWVTAGATGTRTITGMGRTVMQEHPELDCTLVDLDPEDGVAALARELAASDRESEVALRGDERFVARLRRAPHESTERSLDLSGKTVLVTGGLGALGLEVARFFAAAGVAHLVLTGRRGEETPGASEAVRALSALGASVTVAAVDVSDRAALARVIDAVPAAWPLAGVVHAAGVIDDGVIASQDADRFASVLSPKVIGAWNLHELTRDRPLDLFVLFSSISGLLGSAGQSNYAAANTFLDALAEERRSSGSTAQSLAWGAWSDVGLAARTRVRREGLGWISPADGIALFARAIARPEANLAVIPLDLETTRRAFGTSVPSVWRALLPAPPVVASGTWRARLATLREDDVADEVRSAVRTDVARVLGWDAKRPLPLDRPLSDLGLDSLMAVEVRNALGERVGTSLPATLVFDHPTIDAIASWLREHVLALGTAIETPMTATTATEEPIAIIGIGCRFPGGLDSPESFWRLLDDGVDAITEVPRARWDIDAWYDPDPEALGKMTTRWGGFLSEIERFDPAFFGISPREAASIDPQARLLLETSWEALERAGQTPERLMGSDTAVFVGLCGNEYQTQAIKEASAIDAYSFLGTAHSAIVGRLSYFLGLKGPNLAVDTACSSSLVAVHLGCEALRRGESRLALVGGANVVLSPEGTVYFSRLRAMSPTGRCHTFSADADGYVRSEGCGVLVLKRLADAERDGDRVLAVIRGSAVNQDGRSNGLTAPNGPSQEAVIRQALARGGVRPAEIDYVECHGTGTPLGDPIEVQALAKALGEGRAADRPVVLGSVKTNIGHTEGAAGVAGLIKTVLALEHGRIPKSLHFGQPNPHVPWSELKVSVAAEAVPWPRNGTPRRAGVSSFGFSGTNAHVVLEEAPPPAPRPLPDSRDARLLVLSAKTAEALIEQTSRLEAYLSARPELDLADVAYTLATRTPMEHRTALVATSRGARSAGVRGAALAPGKLAFVFSGQGAQTPGMGRGLCETWPVFREAFDRCLALFDPDLPRPLREVMWGEPGTADAALLDQTLYTQPALFTLEHALVALWRSWGVTPDLVLGHSIGELAAACAAGVFSLADAARLVSARARLMQALPAGGAMMSIAAPEADVAAAVARHEGVAIAAVNGPSLVVVSGAEAPVLEIARELAERGVRTKRLAVSHPFHSSWMDPMLDAFARVAETVSYARPAIELVNDVTGLVGDEPTTPAYWVRQVREAVRFADGVKTLAGAGVTTFVEIGPKAGLLAMTDLASIPSLRADRPEAEAILAALGAVFVRGGAVDWKAVLPEAARRVDLPSYPWQRERHWVSRGGIAAGAAGRWPLSGARHRMPGNVLHHVLPVGTQHQPFLEDHVVFGKVVVPGAFHVAAILAIAAEEWPDRALEISDMEFLRVVPLEPNVEVALHAVLTPEAIGEAHRFELSTWTEAEARWTTHARGRVAPCGDAPRPRPSTETATRPVDEVALFARLSAMRVDWGPRWRWLHDARFGGGVSTAMLVPTEPTANEVAPLHPCLVDNGFAVASLDWLDDPEDATPRLPFAIERLRWWRAPRGSVRCEGVSRPGEPGVGDFAIVDEDGSPIAEVHGFVCRRAPAEAFLPRTSSGSLYRLAWVEAPLPDATAPPEDASFIVVAGSRSETATALRGRLARCEIVEPAGLDEALAKASSPLGVICLWEAREEEAPHEAAHRLATEALAVVQALRGRAGGGLWWVTRHAVATTPREHVEVAASPIWGLGRTVMQEHPELRCTLVDAADDVALVRELTANDDESQVSWRAGRRLVARLERGDAATSATSAPREATSTGTVLVTGGLGALGLHVARSLARRGTAHLLLTGRRGLATPGAAAAVRELEALGAKVTVTALDVADRDALAAAIDGIPRDLPLRGVVHAAGVLDDGVLAEQDAERFARVLAPKIAGSFHLHELTADLALDFFVLFSSMAGLLGAAGQSNYAAANTFLDAIAAHRQARGLPAQSLAWGAWSEGGMAAGTSAAQQARLARQGVKALSPARGVALFDEASGRPEAHLGVMQLDLDVVGRALGARVPSVWRALIKQPVRSSGYTNGAWTSRLAALPAAHRADEVRAAVQAEVARVLSLGAASSVPVDRSFLELGLDSLMAVELRNALGARLGVTLPATLAFDYPTPAALARYLLDKVLAPKEKEPAPARLADAEIRAALAAIPIAALRQTDLLAKLLELAKRTRHVALPAAPKAASIDEMGTDELIGMFGIDDDAAAPADENRDE